MTESFADYTRQNLITKYPTVETFLTAWFNTERKKAIVTLKYGQRIEQLEGLS